MSISRMQTRGAITIAAAVLAALPAAAQGISNDVVRIGVMGDQVGPYSDNCGAGSVAAARMAVEDAGGSIDGKPIEIVVADDQNKPDIGVASALRWVDDEDVDTIVGCSASSIALAIQDIMRERDKPYLIAGTASSDLTNSACSPMASQWVLDTYSLPRATVRSLIEQGLDTWYFITVDYTFGKKWQEDATRFIEADGGTVVGSTLHPLNSNDFSSYILQAQASGAKVIALANSGSDFANVVKQAQEFGITEGGQKLAPLGVQINQVHGIGLEQAQGLQITTPFYWDHDDEARAFTERFKTAFNGAVPNESQAGTYSAVSHYLKAVAATGTDDGKTVVARMHETPIDDFSMKGVMIREDGQVMRPMYAARIKSPQESTGPYDYYEITAEIPATEAWRPAAESVCPLIEK